MHEASLHEDNCFITLTFSNEALYKRENPWSVDVREYQLFMKRLRKKYGSNIRFFHCGEYGEKTFRPHYHAILFNFDFPDKKLHQIKRGNRLYVSESLQKLWPYGHSVIGDVTFESAAYVARYVTKKVNGENAKEHYTKELVDKETGEIVGETLINPEYATMSRRPGIASEWFNKYVEDAYPHDFVIIRGKKVKPPKYYDKLLEQYDPDTYAKVIEDRIKSHEEFSENNTVDRLRVREKIHEKKAERLKRTDT